MPKIDLTRAQRLKFRGREVLAIKGPGFFWVRPDGAVVEQDIEYLWSGQTLGPDGTIPAEALEPGLFIIAWAVQGNNTTPISVPGGWDRIIARESNTAASLVFARVNGANADNTLPCASIGAVRTQAIALRGVSPVNPIHAVDAAGGTGSAVIVHPGLPLAKPSVVIAGYHHRVNVTTPESPHVNRATLYSTGFHRQFFGFSEGAPLVPARVATFPGHETTLSANSSGHHSVAVAFNAAEDGAPDPDPIIRTAVWNPEDLSGDITLTGDSLTATGGAQFGHVRSSAGRDGRVHFEIEVVSATSGMAIGLASHGDLGDFGGANANAIGLFENGWVAFNGSWDNFSAAFASGTVISFAYDLGNGRFWARADGGPWNGSAGADPAADIGGYAYQIPGDEVFAFASLDDIAEVRANFGATPYAHAPPAGFWNLEAEVAPPSPAGGSVGAGIWLEDEEVAPFVEGLAPAGGAPFGWYYNWWHTPAVYPGGLARTVEFVPMIWGSWSLGQPIPEDARVLLGYNEPDGGDPSHQSGITPQQALLDWPVMEAYGEHVRLGSPAPTQGQALGQGSWLRIFMDGVAAQGLRVDFIAVHFYTTNPSVQAFKTWLDQVHAAYGRPIWVTEWALIDWDNLGAISQSQAAAFAAEALEMLEAHPHVERHAYFSVKPYDTPWGAGTTTGYLVNEGLTARTRVGEVFNDFLFGLTPGPGPGPGPSAIEYIPDGAWLVPPATFLIPEAARVPGAVTFVMLIQSDTASVPPEPQGWATVDSRSSNSAGTRLVWRAWQDGDPWALEAGGVNAVVLRHYLGVDTADPVITVSQMGGGASGSLPELSFSGTEHVVEFYFHRLNVTPGLPAYYSEDPPINAVRRFSGFARGFMLDRGEISGPAPELLLGDFASGGFHSYRFALRKAGS